MPQAGGTASAKAPGPAQGLYIPAAHTVIRTAVCALFLVPEGWTHRQNLRLSTSKSSASSAALQMLLSQPQPAVSPGVYPAACLGQ